MFQMCYGRFKIECFSDTEVLTCSQNITRRQACPLPYSFAGTTVAHTKVTSTIRIAICLLCLFGHIDYILFFSVTAVTRPKIPFMPNNSSKMLPKFKSVYYYQFSTIRHDSFVCRLAMCLVTSIAASYHFDNVYDLFIQPKKTPFDLRIDPGPSGLR